MVDTTELIIIGSIVSCSEGIFSRYARFICAMNLHLIVDIFKKCWSLSVTLDMETHTTTTYCNVCIRI